MKMVSQSLPQAALRVRRAADVKYFVLRAVNVDTFSVRGLKLHSASRKNMTGLKKQICQQFFDGALFLVLHFGYATLIA